MKGGATAGDRGRGAWEPRVGPWLATSFACLGLLAVSGAWLSVRYRPDRPEPADRLGRFRTPGTGGGWVGDVHRLLAIALYLSLAGLVVVLVLDAIRRTDRSWIAAGLVPVVVVATVVARASGEGLPWSQVAVRAVRVNTSYRGVWRAAYDPLVRFVLTEVETTRAHYRISVIVHLFAAPALLLAAVLAAALLMQRRR
jgi:quinol-cytochrome oxidoreductase complex cytochrome b subunit